MGKSPYKFRLGIHRTLGRISFCFNGLLNSDFSFFLFEGDKDVIEGWNLGLAGKDGDE